MKVKMLILGKFPIPKFSELDGGPYLTAGISISKDPETGIADLGHYRFQAIGKDYFGFMAQPVSQTWEKL